MTRDGAIREQPALRSGFTTGTCAAAAAKAAVMTLFGMRSPDRIDVTLPDGSSATILVASAGRDGESAWAAVRKDAGDDPDVTDGALVQATVSWTEGEDVIILAGEGVGTVTKPGLAVPPGEPAINPVPRRMIRDAVREVTHRPIAVTISIPGGKEIAEKTFNPRLGIVGGLSILGTSGIVRPFSSSALKDALKCSLSVAVACGVQYPVFVPGRIGQRAAARHFRPLPEQLIEVSNEWGFMLDQAAQLGFRGLLALGHPGKLAKLADGQWDTHSKRSRSAVPMVTALVRNLLGWSVDDPATVEAIFSHLPPESARIVADGLSAKIRDAISRRVSGRFTVSVVVVNLLGEVLGNGGDLSPWPQR